MHVTRRSLLGSIGAAAVLARVRPLRALMSESDRIAVFRKAKFGMFIHWGPYSVAGVEASWPIMTPNGEITEAEYRALPSRFNPARFDPNAWIDLAESAGQKYMVFTTKHHDGFCMFDSDFTDYKITKTPYGKDTVRQLADACHSRQMPLGFYYSPPDMNHPAYRDTSKLSATNYRGEPDRPEWPLYLDYMQLQLGELLTRYGSVAEVWFDAVDPSTQSRYDGQRFIDQIRRLQPAAVINNRIGVPGDFLTPEQFIPRAIPVRGLRIDSPDHSLADKQPIVVPRPEDFQPWETCMTINDTWAYRGKDRDFKSVDKLIRSLIEVVSRGGNFLLDVGPQPDGQIQPEFVERLQGLGKWVKKNGAAIYDSTYGPVQGEAQFRTSSRGKAVFVFVMDPSATQLSIRGLGRHVESARLLGSNEPIEVHIHNDGVQLDMKTAFWVDGVPVIELL